MEKRLVKDVLYSKYHIEIAEEEIIQISDIGCELLPTDYIFVDCDGDEANFEIYRMREETDDEVRTRHNKERKSAILAAEAERENYNRTKEAYFRMKQKFEPDNV